MEAARCLIHAKNVPLELWGEAIACAVYTLNRVSTKTAPNTPYQNWFGTKPDVSNLRIFGSTAYIHVPKAERRKLDSKSVTCHFVGYCATQKAYRFWDPITRKIRVSRDVIFNEQAFDTPRQDPTSDNDFAARRLLLGPLASAPKEAMPENVVDTTPSPPYNENNLPDSILLPESPIIDPVPPTPIVDYPPSVSPAPEANPPSPNIHLQDDVNTNAPNNHVRHSKYPLRIREPKRRWDESLLSAVESCEPKTYMDAMTSPDHLHWKQAIQEEHDSLLRNQTWTLKPLPPGGSLIKCRWVLTIKPGVRGTEPRYKARLVAKGYSQRYGIDYEETFAPVAKQDTLRLILSFVAVYDLEMRQLDIKTAFLYGELEEELYLEQPEGFVTAGQENLVCHLHKCLYGLKQASRVWNRHFDAFLRKFGLIPSESDPCLYHRHHKEEFTMVIIWVDDGLVCSNSSKAISDIINYLADHFEMRSSEANHFVGLSIFRNRKEKTLYLSQPEYTEKILQRFHMDGCHPVSLPATPGAFLNKEENLKKTIQVPFKEAIGSLMYLMLSSRPDIAFALNQASQFCENPQAAHWAAVKKIFSYLQGTKNYGLRYGPSLVAPVGYSDSDYAGDINTRQSTSGFIFLLNEGPIAWSSRRQNCVALSTTEAEYVAACEAAKESVWLRRLLLEIIPDWKQPLPLLCDNISSIELTRSPKFHQRTKHIDVRFHFIRAQQEAKEIDVKYTPTTEQLADPFTKPLPNPRFSILRKAIGVVPVPDL
jgi:hypothetical protein